MAETFNLNALVDEAREESHPFTFGPDNEKFALPAIEDWPLEVVDHLDSGRVVEAMRGALGDQWEAFSAHKPTLRTVRVLMDKITKDQGLGESGNSSGSPSSSKSTAKRQKPTSSATTK